VDNAVSIKRHRDFKDGPRQCFIKFLMVYAPHSGKPEKAKESFWNEVFI